MPFLLHIGDIHHCRVVLAMVEERTRHGKGCGGRLHAAAFVAVAVVVVVAYSGAGAVVGIDRVLARAGAMIVVLVPVV